MRRIIAPAFVSLDGVMQAPGAPDEDRTGGIEYGGWTVPYWDDVLGQAMADSFAKPFEIVLGRKTYDIFAAHWPHVVTDPSAPGFDAGTAAIAEAFDSVTKYVASRSTSAFSWQNSRWLGEDPVAALRALKEGDGPDLLTQGSSDFLQTLLAADLVDEIRLLTFPVTLGKGKRLFGTGTLPAAFRLTRSSVSPSGVLIAAYERAGAVETGSFALETPSAAEIEQRHNLT